MARNEKEREHEDKAKKKDCRKEGGNRIARKKGRVLRNHNMGKNDQRMQSIKSREKAIDLFGGENERDEKKHERGRMENDTKG